LPAPIGSGRFVIRATHERGVGAPSSRSLATASHEALQAYGRQATNVGPRPALPLVRNDELHVMVPMLGSQPNCDNP